MKNVREAADTLKKANNAYESNEYNDAIQLFSEAIRTMPHFATLRVKRAQSHLNMGDTEAAIGDLIKASKLDASLVEPLLNLANIYFYVLNEREKGMTYVRQCIHSDPEQKQCKKFFREGKKLNKEFEKLNKLQIGRNWKGLVELMEGEDGVLSKVNNALVSAFGQAPHSFLVESLHVMKGRAHVKVKHKVFSLFRPFY
jgi:tetratricopeptide (TPR) repeat protein